MTWTKPKFSKSKIDWAGNILININSSINEREKALEILDNWRAIHRYSMRFSSNNG